MVTQNKEEIGRAKDLLIDKQFVMLIDDNERRLGEPMPISLKTSISKIGKAAFDASRLLKLQFVTKTDDNLSSLIK